MADVLRLGGPTMAATAQDGLNQPQDKLHDAGQPGALAGHPARPGVQQGQGRGDQGMDALNALRDGWEKPLDGLDTPGGFSETGFHWPPGSPGDGKDDFYGQTGLTKWVADRFWKSEFDFYEDPTPKADAATSRPSKDLGTPLYGKEPDPSSPSGTVSSPSRGRSSICGLVP